MDINTYIQQMETHREQGHVMLNTLKQERARMDAQIATLEKWIGTQTTAPSGSGTERVTTVLKHAAQPMTASEIWERVGDKKMARTVVSTSLHVLVKKGLVSTRGKRGDYRYFFKDQNDQQGIGPSSPGA